MSRNAGRAVAASCTLVVVLGVGMLVYTAFIGDRAVAQAIPDVGKFRAGSDLGEERAGFSGRHRFYVFITPSSPGWNNVMSCLQSEEISNRIDNYTGILVDPTVDEKVEEILRTRDGLQIVIRAMNGEFLGGLRSDFTCNDLASLLDAINAYAPFVEMSPIYAALLESSEPIKALKNAGRVDDAARFIYLLEELEGRDSAAVRSAEAELLK